jgi:uncharacterized protein
MKETPFFFGPPGRSLFGVLHQPERIAEGPAFVFCHPFGEEKLWTHRVFVTFARRLAADGFPVLRFDYRGNGDSEGRFSESSLETVLADVRQAVQEARRATGACAINLLGLRLGASIASLAAEELPDVDSLVLWAPIVDGDRYVQELLRSNLTAQVVMYKEIRHDREALVEQMRQGATVSIEGYDLAFPMYAEVSRLKLSAGSKRYGGRSLVVQIERQQTNPSAEIQQLAGSYGRSTCAVVREEPFWKEIPQFYQQAPNLFETTLTWIRSSDAP